MIHCPVFYLKHIASEIEFCLCLQVEPTQVGLIERDSLCIYLFCPNMYVPSENGDRVQSLKRSVLNKIPGRWIISRIVTVILMIHVHLGLRVGPFL
jgi:hypothetical protein